MARRTRSLVALAGVCLLTIGAAGCSGGSDETALTVNGREYSQASVERELSAIADSAELGPYVTKKDGSVKDDVAATWLTGLVEAQVAQEEVARGDLPVTKADRTIAEQRAIQLFGQASIFSGFPKWFQKILRERYAAAAAVVRANGTPPTDEQIRAQYEASVKESCASHRFVSHILVKDKARADQIAAELFAGGDFRSLAVKYSTDASTAPSGGDLACLDGQQLDPAFQAAADALAVGGTSAPVQSQFGWHIIHVRDIYDAVPYEKVADSIRNDLATSDPVGRQSLNKLMAKAKVKVAKAYGRWAVDKKGRGQVKP